MGGSFIAFNKNEKRTVFTGTSDQGELFVCDWAARSADEAGSKNDTIVSFWNHERCFRPVVALDLLPSNESIILTVYDFHFCIWKNNIDVDLNIFRSHSSQAWSGKVHFILLAAGVQAGQGSALSASPTAPSTFGTSWISPTNGRCSIQLAPSGFLQ